MELCVKDPPARSASRVATLGDDADLAQIMRAYNEATDKLQHSHEVLRAEVVRLQRQLVSTDAQLQRSRRLAALGEMAAGIAHEIRNPLAAIHLYARMVADDLGQLVDAAPDRVAATSQTVRKIADGVRGLNAIVNDVLTFAREIHPRKASLEACDAITRAVEAHRPAIDAAGVRVLIEANNISIHADADLLHQALLNLIRNAVDAMTHGGTLGITAKRQDEQVVLTVRDTGPGIGEADVDRIFNPFFTTRSTGTGLGLAIVHRIVDAHGGSISVANDGGAVFTLNLPCSGRTA